MNKIKIKGHIKIEDSKGNILVDKDNMILHAGRSEIMQNGLENFNTIYFGDNSDFATEDNTIKYLSNNTEYFKDTERKVVVDGYRQKEKLSFSKDHENLKAIAKATFSNKGNTIPLFKLSTIGLGNNSDKGDVLYTRVVFSPITMPSDSDVSYTITYTLYF